MAARTRLAPEVRHAEILEVAQQIFVDNDYASVSMAAIAERAGVTPGLVNHYFGTKRELYLTVLRRIAKEMPPVVRTDLEGLPTEEMVDRNLHAFLDAAERNQEAWSLLFGAQALRDPEVSRIVAEVRLETAERMAHNHSPDPTGELRLALRIFLGAGETAAAEWLRGRATREEVYLPLFRMLLAATRDAHGPAG